MEMSRTVCKGPCQRLLFPTCQSTAQDDSFGHTEPMRAWKGGAGDPSFVAYMAMHLQGCMVPFLMTRYLAATFFLDLLIWKEYKQNAWPCSIRIIRLQYSCCSCRRHCCCCQPTPFPLPLPLLPVNSNVMSFLNFVFVFLNFILYLLLSH